MCCTSLPHTTVAVINVLGANLECRYIFLESNLLIIDIVYDSLLEPGERAPQKDRVAAEPDGELVFH